MKKIFFIFTVFILSMNFAHADNLITTNVQNGCDFNSDRVIVARFAPDEYTCNSGYYLPADATACTSCLTGYTCVGGTFAFNEDINQGIVLNTPITTNVDNGCTAKLLNRNQFYAKFAPNEYTCNPGYYLPADAIACVQCPAGSACVGGTYTYNESVSQGIVACTSPTPYAPTGSTVCYPHILHVGNDNVYLRSTKQTTPSLNIQIGNDIFYANMTITPTYMNKDSSHYLHILYEGDDYYVCDDTTYGQ